MWLTVILTVLTVIIAALTGALVWDALERHVKKLAAAVRANSEVTLLMAGADLEAIAAFAALANRLDALAAERARPWWRRLAG